MNLALFLWMTSMKRNIAPGWWIIPGSLLGVALWALAGAAVAHIIWNDPGGGINSYARAVDAGPPAEIRGYCASACTMWLANGCVHPDATLAFHGAVYPSGNPMPPDRQDYWDGYMAEYYPPAIAAWYMTLGRFGENRLSGAQAIEMGAVPC